MEQKRKKLKIDGKNQTREGNGGTNMRGRQASKQTKEQLGLTGLGVVSESER